jgi:hypothetical protein
MLIKTGMKENKNILLVEKYLKQETSLNPPNDIKMVCGLLLSLLLYLFWNKKSLYNKKIPYFLGFFCAKIFYACNALIISGIN